MSAISLTLLLTFWWGRGSCFHGNYDAMLTSVILCLKIPIVCCFDIYCKQLQEEDVCRNVIKKNTNRHRHCMLAPEQLVMHVNSRKQWNSGHDFFRKQKTDKKTQLPVGRKRSHRLLEKTEIHDLHFAIQTEVLFK